RIVPAFCGLATRALDADDEFDAVAHRERDHIRRRRIVHELAVDAGDAGVVGQEERHRKVRPGKMVERRRDDPAQEGRGSAGHELVVDLEHDRRPVTHRSRDFFSSLLLPYAARIRETTSWRTMSAEDRREMQMPLTPFNRWIASTRP